jgi:hypothetical protein
VVCIPSSICIHGSRTCNQCSPGVTKAGRCNLITRHKKERVIFFNYMAAEFLALTEEKQCKLTCNFKDLQDRALIESGQEEKRSALRSLKEQVARGAMLHIARGPQCDQGLFGATPGTVFFLKDELLLLQ